MVVRLWIFLGFHSNDLRVEQVFLVLAAPVGPALLLFKAKACGLLVLLHRAAPARVGITVLRALAAVYCILSLGPWLGKFVSLATTLL